MARRRSRVVAPVGVVVRLLVVAVGASALVRRVTVRCAAPALRAGTTATIISLNAGGVTQVAVDAARGVLGEANVFATSSLYEARAAAATIVDRGYATVVTCGGDGTLAAAIRHICDARRAAGEAAPLDRMPRFAPFPLGTGNAVARFACGPQYARLKRPRHFVQALETVVAATADDASARELSVPLIQVDSGELCFLAGVGYDAFILDDYAKLLRRSERLPACLRRRLKSVFGYFVATATRTLPAYLTGQRKMRVRISARNASYVDPRRGDAVLAVRDTAAAAGDLDPLDVLYEGRATIVAAGSTPFYGGGMRLFPFARNAPMDQMHLRVARMSPWTFVPNVLGIFSGFYRNPNDAFDFVGSHFKVELLDGAVYPFQHSGDADSLRGERSAFQLTVATHLRFVDLLGMPQPINHLTPR